MGQVGHVAVRRSLLVNQERRSSIEKGAHNAIGLFGQPDFVQGRAHQPQPAVAGFVANGEPGVPHPQSGMAAGFDISRRPSEPEDKKVAEALFGASEIVFSVHRPQKIVMRNPPVERGDQTRETLVTDQAINFLFLHNIVC
jgi:hypothetical protein